MPEQREQALTATVAAIDAGARLDVFLSRHFPELSRSQVQRLIREGRVRLADGRATKSGEIVKSGWIVHVTVPPPAAAVPLPEALPLSILHDDPDLVAIDKPAGMVVHPAAGHSSGTLVNALLHHVSGLSGIGGETRPGIVHRLDRGTSGVMIVAKNDRAHRELARQFHDREVRKEYTALVWGAPRAGEVIDAPIGRHLKHRTKMSSRGRAGRAALTRVESVEALGGVSLVRVTIGTGRTHQIRVHLSERGHPVVGDELYGGVRARLPARLRALASLARPFLHASSLSVTHPTTGEGMRFDAPLPDELNQLLVALRAVSQSRKEAEKNSTGQ